MQIRNRVCYHKIGRFKWGSGFIKQVSEDLSKEFPDVRGFSFTNIKLIKQWYLFYDKHITKSQQAVDQLQKTEDVVLQLENVKSQQAVGQLESAKGKQAVSQLEDVKITQELSQITQIPWGHNILIVQKSKPVPQSRLDSKSNLNLSC